MKGDVVTASDDQNAELLWALRGGGGNFGVVTSMTFALHELGPEVPFSGIFYGLSDMEQVLLGWRDAVAAAPRELSANVVAVTVPPIAELPVEMHDRPACFVGGLYAGPLADGMRAIEPLRRLREPLLDISGPTTYCALQSQLDPPFARGALRAYWSSRYMNELTKEAVTTLAAIARDRPVPLTSVEILHMGGAVSDVDPGATAFAQRTSPFLASVAANWLYAEDDERVVRWTRSASARLGDHATGAGYLNFSGSMGEAAAARVDAAYGPNLRRLAEVKAAYDPDNFFRCNDNIAPAAARDEVHSHAMNQPTRPMRC